MSDQGTWGEKCSQCGRKCDLFKLHDEVWPAAPNDKLCIGCTEAILRRPIHLSDVEPVFPWWGTDRPEYFLGFRDGTAEPISIQETVNLYDEGLKVGSRLARNAPGDAAAFPHGFRRFRWAEACFFQLEI